MFFWASKVLWLIVNPGNILLILLILGLALLWTRWWKAGRRLVGFVALTGLILAVFPVGKWMYGALEDRFPPYRKPHVQVDGIIVAGGIVNPVLTVDRGQISIGAGAERLFAMVALAKKYPQAKLIFTGGSGLLLHQDKKEAHFVGPLLEQLGVAPGRVIFEDQSRNTVENVTFSLPLAKPKAGETWLLVTSAFHMPRAVGAFRKAGWEVTPYPVDYRTRGETEPPLQFNFAYGMGSLGGALHEYVGLLTYWLVGNTDELFPGPR